MAFTLRWDEVSSDQPWLKAIEHHLAPLGVVDCHAHDFYEATWLLEGTCHHICNGRVDIVRPGRAMFLRPQDQHHLSSPDGARIATIGFQADLIEAARQRYAGELAWPWGDGSAPAVIDCAATRLGEVWRLGVDAMQSRRRIDADRVLIQLIQAACPSVATEPLPIWLADAIDTMEQSPRLVDGVAGLVRLCNRSAVHVARTVQRHLGCTPQALVLRLRMERAGMLLRYRRMTVRAVAEAVGLPHLGNFHSRFKAHFGVSPARFRTRPAE